MFQARLEDTESRLRRLQDDKDLQMNSIISRSVCLSLRLRLAVSSSSFPSDS